ncbi:MAG: 50S ribosomal protein L22 [Candidatus Niyogibacteria bacterium]|nr:MAG: 50S ribosomal protein L22 [Candidatus Niyogibacteria bacterium]
MKAELNYIRIAPRKLRLVADAIRGKNIDEVRTILKFSKKGAAKPMAKLLESAAANARNNLSSLPKNLYISKLTVDEGPVFKRFMARARGVPSLIRKKTSRVRLVLAEKEK